ncbi:MAG TPA: response regulator transcription factor [Terriglobales bacterium]|jgi:DNA-binding NarL/FixJ family response regulator|nr:response regulator transcription factor [Terriglobales bacterium]
MRILIADDHPIFRAGLKEILARERDVKSIGEAEDGQKALALARNQHWDVAVIDIRMPGRDGLEVLNELQREQPNLPILILSAHPEDQLAFRMLKAGAAGYLTKEKAPEVLITAIRKVLQGEKYISQSLAERVALEVVGGRTGLPHEKLSDREYQVMRMIAAGRTLTEIGKELFLSVRTVSTYRARILEKMGMKTNAELIRYALDHKLVD